MNGSIMPLWPSLLPPVCDQLWFTADFPKNEEAELAALEEELEQEKQLLKEQSKVSKKYFITLNLLGLIKLFLPNKNIIF
jgi:hypothetical protein